MRILLDNCTPRGVGASLRGHDVRECRAEGWDHLKNGDLLEAAERAGFDVVITADQSIPRQQSLAGRKIAIVALGSNQWRVIQPHLPRVADAVERVRAGRIVEVSFPRE